MRRRLFSLIIYLLIIKHLFIEVVYTCADTHTSKQHPHHHIQSDNNRITRKVNDNNTYQRRGENRRSSGTRPLDPEKVEQIEREFLNHRKLLMNQSQTNSSRQNTTITIRVYVTIMEHRSIPNSFVEDYEVVRQIDILNDAFAGNPGSLYPYDCSGAILEGPFTNTRIQFQLWNTFHESQCETDAVQSLVQGSSNERTMKSNYRRGGNDCTVLNIYISNLVGNFGWASFPTECGGSSTYLDGVVLDRDVLPGGKQTYYNEGDVLVHEVGHWLGLYHTFGDCDPGDYIDDTPPQLTETNGCPAYKDTCTGDGLYDPIHNYMDYSDDCCMYEFTEGQATRMRFFFDNYRNVNEFNKNDEDDCEASGLNQVISFVADTITPKNAHYCPPFCENHLMPSKNLQTLVCNLFSCSH